MKDSTDHAAELILYEVKAQSLSYRRHVPWAEEGEAEQGDEEVLLREDPSVELLGMLQSLSANLTSFCQRLKPSLVDKVQISISDR